MAALRSLDDDRLSVPRTNSRISAHPNPDHDVLRHEQAVCCSRREDDWEAGLDALYEREDVVYGKRGETTRIGHTKDTT